MYFITHYIYVIHEEEFIKTDRDIYKISRVASKFNKIPEFPDGSSIKIVMQVNDVYKAEDEILRQLEKCETVVLYNYKCVGKEYFQGSLDTILQIVFDATSLTNRSL